MELQKLIRITLDNGAVEFQGRTGMVQGFTAGAGYPQVWLRDAATIIPASRFFYPDAFLVTWLEEHLAFQKADGGLEDWIDSQGKSDKNTVETDQEASAVQSAYQVFLLKGKGWLEKKSAANRSSAVSKRPSNSFFGTGLTGNAGSSPAPTPRTGGYRP